MTEDHFFKVPNIPFEVIQQHKKYNCYDDKYSMSYELANDYGTVSFVL